MTDKDPTMGRVSEIVEQEEVAVAVPPLTLGWRMQMAMAHGGRSIEHMAMTCGVGRSTVSRWIHDNGRRPRRGDLEVWARECRVPFAWLAPNPEEMDDFEQPTHPKLARKLHSITGSGTVETLNRPLVAVVPDATADPRTSL